MFVSRVSDLGAGVCRAGHPDVPVGSNKDYVTVHVSGADTVFTNFLPQAIIGTIGVTDCGHSTTAVSGSDSVFAEFMPIHRIGDVGVINEGEGEHVVVSGSDDVNNDD
jgi:uncharacterized Zn-binding protein involved in type VI secretion